MVQLAERRRGDAVRGALPLCPEFPVTEAATVRFSFRIENFHHIRLAYGAAVARETLENIRLTLAELVADDGVVALAGSGGGDLEVSLHNPLILGKEQLAAGCREWVDGFCGVVPRLAIDTSAGPLRLWLSGGWAVDGAEACRGATSFRFAGDHHRDDPAWAERYRKDMAIVARVLAAIGDDLDGDDLDDDAAPDALRVALHWQPVRDVRSAGEVVYYEGLIRFVDRGGGVRPPDAEVAALERTGFARVLDRHVVALAVSELEWWPDVALGVNISAQSAGSDPWWSEMESRLRKNPGIASRLVIELTETAAIPSISDAVRFALRMRRLGCRIALDDFGTGFASVRQLLAFSPEIVKIDRLFLQRAPLSEKDGAIFAHLAGLAQSLGSTVIVEGVETKVQSDIASRVGLSSQQGHFWGQPTALRPWRAAASRMEPRLPWLARGRPHDGALPSRAALEGRP